MGVVAAGGRPIGRDQPEGYAVHRRRSADGQGQRAGSRGQRGPRGTRRVHGSMDTWRRMPVRGCGPSSVSPTGVPRVTTARYVARQAREQAVSAPGSACRYWGATSAAQASVRRILVSVRHHPSNPKACGQKVAVRLRLHRTIYFRCPPGDGGPVASADGPAGPSPYILRIRVRGTANV